jgi:predicted protein tyrosine phosphatase
VCRKNRRRSPTAEAIFSNIDGIEVSSAGTATDADCQVSSDLLDWADDIVVMELRYAKQMRQKFLTHLKGKRIINLNIPDRFEFMQDELVGQLKTKSSRWL